MVRVKVHHLNCGTMQPWRTPGGLVCHVLLLETPNGLVLVDSGLGLRDRAEPGKRFGPARHYIRPIFAEEETAVRQVARLGFDPHDVRHILLTHFDADHTGGLADFPWAQIHLTGDEADAALNPRGRIEKARYLPAQHDHGPALVRHDPGRGERWKGFAAAEELVDIAPGVVLLSLPGHTRGHAAVAVDTGDRWVLHVGDAFYDHGQIDGTGRTPRTLIALERLVAYDWQRVQENHARLAELWSARDPALLLVNAHDPSLLARAQVIDDSG
jgi:glyoxylase-like metal-dependent hydrolase (beta-lactamase superfamily II)